MSKYRPDKLPSIGTETEQEADTPPRVRTREEVMREWEERRRLEAEQQQAPAPAAAPTAPVAVPAGPAVPAQTAGPTVPGPADALRQELPSPDAPPAEILSDCERIILAARIEFQEAERKAVAAWLGAVGPAVRLVHATKAYKEIADLKGRPYKSFARWAQERCGISRPHAYRMVNEGPVADALAGVYAGQLSTRQVDLLAPVLRQHGEDAVRRVWSTADAAGGTDPARLATARDALELAVQPEDHEPPRELPAVGSADLVRVQRAASGMDRAQLRAAALEDPVAARRAVAEARRFAEELQTVLAEIEGDASSAS